LDAKRGRSWTRFDTEKADYRHYRLLRTRRDRPSRRTADQTDELAPLHAAP
jgi:hypothetical protein